MSCSKSNQDGDEIGFELSKRRLNVNDNASNNQRDISIKTSWNWPCTIIPMIAEKMVIPMEAASGEE